MATDPIVHILILNWNGRHHLEHCLPSVLKSQYRNLRVVVLDNGSNDGSQVWVRDHFPGVQLVEFGRNLGFTGANNWGLRAAISDGADYAVLLNNDTRVEPDWLAPLVDAAERDLSVAICQARQRTWDGKQEMRFRFIPEWAEAQAVLTPVQDPGPPVLSAFASGGVMFVRCAALKKIGLFDERYFIFVEDVDLSLRAWVSGYRVLTVPESIIYHHMHGTVREAKRQMRLGYRNQLTTLFKVYQLETLSHFAAPIRQRWFVTRNRIALRGTLVTLAKLPGTLTRRRSIQRGRRQPDTAFLRHCDP